MTIPHAIKLSEPVANSQDRANFAERARVNFLEVNPVLTSVNEVVDGINEAVDGVAQSASDAQSAANQAFQTSNNRGAWSAQTGAASPPYVVVHTNALWALNTAVADVTAVEPGVDSEWTQLPAGMVAGYQGIGGPSVTIGASDAEDAPIGSNYFFAGTHLQAVTKGLPSITGAADGDAVHWEWTTQGSSSTRVYQEATQTLAVASARGQSFKRVKEDSTWYSWQAVGTGSGGGGNASLPTWELRSFTSADESGGNIATTLNLATAQNYELDFDPSSNLPGTSGAYQITLTGLPTSPTGVVFNIMIYRGGRKGGGVQFILPGGITASWAGTESYGLQAGSEDLVTGIWTPGRPDIIRFSITHKRGS